MKMVPIELDKKRVLKFGTRAFVEIEKALNTTMDKIDFERQETIYVLLYAADPFALIGQGFMGYNMYAFM